MYCIFNSLSTYDVQVDFPVASGGPLEVDPAPVGPRVVGSDAHERENGRRLRPRVELSQELVSPAAAGVGPAAVTASDLLTIAIAETRVLGPDLAFVVRNLVPQVEAEGRRTKTIDDVSVDLE